MPHRSAPVRRWHRRTKASPLLPVFLPERRSSPRSDRPRLPQVKRAEELWGGVHLREDRGPILERHLELVPRCLGRCLERPKEPLQMVDTALERDPEGGLGSCLECADGSLAKHAEVQDLQARQRLLERRSGPHQVKHKDRPRRSGFQHAQGGRPEQGQVRGAHQPEVALVAQVHGGSNGRGEIHTPGKRYQCQRRSHLRRL
mmetsp:Transcript_11378/g.31662  ORF Transcript_11378/g.31662 Transcript_11378/m.31662 type:complete len:202 (+) Transcript_11378:2337-2942(+)